MKVSVIVPVYDVEKYLPTCLDSLLAQTLRDIEIICVNDGSHDDSGAILADYAARDPRVTVIDQPNGGLSVARNTGLARATGKYVSFVDSDDALKPDALETLYARAERDNLDHIIFAAEVFYDEGYRPADDVWTAYYAHKGTYGAVKSGAECFADLVLGGDYVYAAQLRFSLRSRLAQDRLTFRPGMIHEDNLFSFVNDLSARRALVLDDQPYLFRKRADSITTGEVKMKHVIGYLVAFVECLRFACARAFDARVRRAVDRDLNRKYRAACRQYARVRDRRTAPGDWLDCPLAERLLPLIVAKPLPDAWRPATTAENYRRPVVSVIVPVYNAAAHLVQCLESIRAQTLREIEIICVDDGSTDGSGALLELMALLDPRVKVLRTANTGGGAARNTALKFAFGTYLAFFDADDFAAPDLLARLVAKAEAEASDIVVSRSLRYSMAEGRVVRETAFAPSVLARAQKGPMTAAEVADRALIDFGNQPWAKLFRRSFVEAEALRFQEIARANDLLFVNLALATARRLSILDAALYTYRVDEAGTLQATNDATPLLFLDAWAAFRDEATRRGVFEPLRTAFANAVWGGCLFTATRLSTEAARRALASRLKNGALESFGIAALTASTCSSRARWDALTRFRATGEL